MVFNRKTYRHRYTIRLLGHDYRRPGYYFVTICTGARIRFFSHLKNNRVILNEYSLIARREGLKTARIRAGGQLDA